MMFTEVSFEDGGIDKPQVDPLSGTVPSVLPHVVEPSVYTLRFHQPGEEGFCSVANGEGAGVKESASWVDSRTINGDSWVSKECHCIKCECIRVIVALSRLEESTGQTLALVLLDLDNFGFNQFKTVPPVLKRSRGRKRNTPGIRRPRTETTCDNHADDSGDEGETCYPSEVDVFQHIFVWAFFGSCFGRYHGTWPSEETVSETLEPRRQRTRCGKANQLSSPATTQISMPVMTPNTSVDSVHRLTVWQRLVAAGRIHFTACGGQDQGADEVITSVINTFIQRDIVLITCDAKLIRHITGLYQGSEGHISTGRFCKINAGNVGKRFVPVWRALSDQICKFVIRDSRENRACSKRNMLEGISEQVDRGA